MARPLLEKHAKAIELRKQGWSYSAIKSELGVSKSTLSLWLRRFPLTKNQIRALSWDNERRIERFRETMRGKREVRLRSVYNDEKRSLLPISERELFLIGLALYWGEGAKTVSGVVSFSNTDSTMICVYMVWLVRCLQILKKDVVIRLHLYRDMDIEEEIEYWSSCLDIPTSQFAKPYIKKTTLRGLTYKTFGHGTCNVLVSGVSYYEKVMMGIRVIADHALSEMV